MIKFHRILLLLLLINSIKIPPDLVPVVYTNKIEPDALATPFVIFSKYENEEIINHEKCHIKQMNKYGSVWYFMLNGYYLYKYTYYNNPFEQQAYNNCKEM